MAPAMTIHIDGYDKNIGPHPSFIEVAKPYIFEQRLQESMLNIGMIEAKGDIIRLQGVTWIDSVRKQMQLPVRTYNTAIVYYHKFCLVHPESEYNFADAAAAALFTACKIEDTLKKSREVLCAAYNMKLVPAEHLSPDDPIFDQHSRQILGLERLMLEAAGFDFRNRHPQKLVVKLARLCGLDRQTAGKMAYNMCLDIYRTFAPLKQTTSTLAIACVELAARVSGSDLSAVVGEQGINYRRWGTSRAEVMETLMDLLDLYTHHKTSSIIGPDTHLDTIINIRITLNQEASASEIPRYTQWREKDTNSNGTQTPKNGVSTSPREVAAGSPSVSGKRGVDGTVRFMLDAGRANNETSEVQRFFKNEEEEYEIEIEVQKPRRLR